MRKCFAIWQRELMSYFLSASAYITMVVFLLASGATFMWAVTKNDAQGDPLGVVLMVSLFVWLPPFSASMG